MSKRASGSLCVAFLNGASRERLGVSLSVGAAAPFAREQQRFTPALRAHDMTARASWFGDASPVTREIGVAFKEDVLERIDLTDDRARGALEPADAPKVVARVARDAALTIVYRDAHTNPEIDREQHAKSMPHARAYWLTS